MSTVTQADADRLPEFLRSRIYVEPTGERGPDDGCWLWRGDRDHGYGRFEHGGKIFRAHRLVWLELKGPLLPTARFRKDRSVCRGKLNKLCCNPDHWSVSKGD